MPQVETADKGYQYLCFAAEPYEVIAFKVPNLEVDKGENKLFTHWWVTGPLLDQETWPGTYLPAKRNLHIQNTIEVAETEKRMVECWYYQWY